MPVEALLEEIRRKGIEVSAEDVADALWLFVLIQAKEGELGPPPPREAVGAPDGPGENLDAGGTDLPEEDRGGGGAVNLLRPGIKVFPPNERQNTSRARRGSALLIPGARDSDLHLALARALRPLIRGIRSKGKQRIDIAATAERIAELKCTEVAGFPLPWWPVMESGTEPWLDLALIVDDSASMRLWGGRVEQLKELMFSLGAFRDSQVWNLDTSAVENPRLRSAVGSAARRPAELADPAGRRLLLILTDCHGPAWYGQALKQVLYSLASSQPLVLVQMLPERLWSRTALAAAAKVWLRPSRPGVLSQSTAGFASPPLPLVSLSPDDMAEWALCLAARQGAETRGAVFESTAEDQQLFAPLRGYDNFRRRASTQAQDLARVLAEIPAVGLPILRLIQRVMLPASDSGDLAELFLDGILASETFPASVKTALYDLDPAARRLLLEKIALDVADQDHVRRLISLLLPSGSRGAPNVPVMIEDPDGCLPIGSSQKPIGFLDSALPPFAPAESETEPPPEDLDDGLSIAPATGQAANRVGVKAALTHLTRLAQRRSSAESILKKTLAERGNALAEIVLEVAVETGDPIGRLFAEQVATMPDSLVDRLSRKLEELPYREVVPLWELVLEVTRQQLADRKETSAASAPASDRIEAAKLRLTMGNQLRKFGRLDKALEAIGFAVAEFRALFRSGSAARSGLAEALAAQGLALLEAGQVDSAESAVREAAELARLSGFRPQLAEALRVHASALRDLGRIHESLELGSESISMFRVLDGRGSPVYRGPLASALAEQAENYAAIGKNSMAFELATEAAAILEELSSSAVEAYQPALARSFDVLAIASLGLDQAAQAISASEKAVDCFRRLAAARPRAFSANLARSLVNLARVHAGRQTPRALEALDEAIAIFKALARERSAAVSSYLDAAVALRDRLSKELAESAAGSAPSNIREVRAQEKRQSSQASPPPPAKNADGPLLILEMTVVGRSLRFELQDGAQFHRFEKSWSTQGLQSLRSRVDGHLQGHLTLSSIHDLGIDLSNRILPEPLRRRLASIGESSSRSSAEPPTLWVISDEFWIPWEIFCLAEGGRTPKFLGGAFALSHWNFDLEASLALPLRQLAIVGGLGSGSKWAWEELELVKSLHKAGSRRVVEIENSRRGIVAALAAKRFDGWHLIGHGAESFESLELSPLSSSEPAATSRDFGGSRPLIFLNSSNLALARSFVEAGAGALIVPRWAVGDRAAMLFAEAFYEFFLAGAPVAKAMLLARRQMRQVIPETIDWLAYTVFCQPAAGLQAANAILPARRRGDDTYLKLPWQVWRPEFSPPGTLLRADHGIVPFHGREMELADLSRWCREKVSIGVRLYTSPGGMGKTRLALEACRQLRLEGWRTGFATSAADRSAGDAIRELANGSGPLLVVVDYVETRRAFLIALLGGLMAAGGEKARVLLLARSREDWWELLKREGTEVGDLISSPATRHVALQPLTNTAEERQTAYRIASRAFAEALGKAIPLDLPEYLDGEHYRPILIIQMAALAAVEGSLLKDENGILDWMLAREKRFWDSQAVARRLPNDLMPGIARAMCAITLGGGTVSKKGTLALLEALKFFQGQPRSVLDNIARLLHQTYPGDRWVMPLQPDILGEHLLERELVDDPQEIFDLVLGSRNPD